MAHLHEPSRTIDKEPAAAPTWTPPVTVEVVGVKVSDQFWREAIEARVRAGKGNLLSRIGRPTGVLVPIGMSDADVLSAMDAMRGAGLVLPCDIGEAAYPLCIMGRRPYVPSGPEESAVDINLAVKAGGGEYVVVSERARALNTAEVIARMSRGASAARAPDTTMIARNVIVVVHGSALTAARPNDIDAIFAGDRGEAERIVREWAVARFGERGATLPIDMHATCGADGVIANGPRQGELHDYMTVPKVPGREAPYEVLAGTPEVEVVEYNRLASWLRSPLPAAEMHAAIADGWRVRFAIGDPVPDSIVNDWRGYVDGRQALRRAIGKCAVWAELRALDPALYGLIEAVIEHGPRNLSPETLTGIMQGSPHGTVDGPMIDVYKPQYSRPLYKDAGERMVSATHGDGAWTIPEFTAMVEGRPYGTGLRA